MNMRSLTLCGLLAIMAMAGHAQEQPAALPSPTLVLSLDDAIAKATAASPRLASARAALGGSAGSERQARAWSNPELAIEAENLAGTGVYRGTDSAEYTYSVAQKLELGKIAPRTRVASATREATALAMQAESLALARDVKIAYGDVLAAQQHVSLTQAQEALARDVRANVETRVDAARDPLIYQSQADISLATATMARQQAERTLQTKRKDLANIWGEQTLDALLDAALLNGLEPPQPLEIYRDQLANSPDASRFQALQRASRSALSLEKAQNIPDPTVSVGLRSFRESREQAMTVGVSLPLPVFDHNRGNIARASAEIQQIESDALTAKLNAEQALQNGWQEWQSAYEESMQLSGSIIPSAEKAYALSREGYARGRFSYLEILNAERTLWDARVQLNQAMQRQWNAKAQVERLTAAPIHGETQAKELK